MPEPAPSPQPPPLAAPAACPQCGTELGPSLLTCPVCRRLVHSGLLTQLAEEAQRSTDAGELARALHSWREALALLPHDSRQAQVIANKVAELSRQVDEGQDKSATGRVAGSRVPPWVKKLGPLGAVALFTWKFKFILTFVLTKGKLLLLGLTKGGTVVSMLLSLGVYWTIWGWRLAAGLIVSIYIHEMGHVAALRKFGIAASAPMFIPGLGAFIRSKHYPATPSEDARVGLAGPVWGLGAALAAYAAFLATGSDYWAAIARLGAWINLFNLLPLWPLDGGRGFRALSRQQRWLLLGVMAATWLVTHETLLVLLGLAGLLRAATPGAPERADWRAAAEFTLLVVSLSVLSQIPVASVRLP